MSFSMGLFREAVVAHLLPLFAGGVFADAAPPRLSTYPYGVILWESIPQTPSLAGDAHNIRHRASFQVDIYEHWEAEDGSLKLAVSQAVNGINLAGSPVRWAGDERAGRMPESELIYSYVTASYQVPMVGALTV